MSPEKALSVVAGASELSAKERQFCQEYFSGEFASNAVRSYLEVYPEAAYGAASVEASGLLKQPRVRHYLRELHEKATALAVAGGMRPWEELIPLAQGILVATADGTLKSRLALDSAKLILDRALGLPVAHTEVQLVNREKAAQALMALQRRMVKTMKGRELHTKRVELSDRPVKVLEPGGDGHVGGS
jgi:hypothetical protein